MSGGAGSGARVCRVPGCGAGLGPKNKHGCCMNHNHDATYCRCDVCARRRARAAAVQPVVHVAVAAPPPPRPPRPGVAHLRVRGEGGSPDGRGGARTVTLPVPRDPALRQEIFG